MNVMMYSSFKFFLIEKWYVEKVFNIIRIALKKAEESIPV